MKQVDVGDDDVMWGVNNKNHIYVRDGRKWKRIAGGLKHVTVGKAGVWGVTSEDKILYRKGVNSSNHYGAEWLQISGIKFSDKPDKISH